LKRVYIWLMLTLAIGAFWGIYAAPQAVELYELSKSHATTAGSILETYPVNHNTCLYQFSSGGRSYKHVGRSCGSYGLGQEITIYFAPTKPESSINRDPQGMFINEVGSFVVAILFLPSLAFWRGWPTRSKGKSSADPGV